MPISTFYCTKRKWSPLASLCGRTCLLDFLHVCHLSNWHAAVWDLTFGYFSLGAVLVLPLTFWRVISYFLPYHFVCQHGWEPFLEGGVHGSWHRANHWHREEKLFLCQEGLGMSRLCRLFHSQLSAKILCAPLCQDLLRERLSVSVWIYRYLINNGADNFYSKCLTYGEEIKGRYVCTSCASPLAVTTSSFPTWTWQVRDFCLFVCSLFFV